VEGDKCPTTTCKKGNGNCPDGECPGGNMSGRSEKCPGRTVRIPQQLLPRPNRHHHHLRRLLMTAEDTFLQIELLDDCAPRRLLSRDK